MSVWGLLQVATNLALGLFCWVLWMRSKRSPKEDSRLSKGLQLLTSKIAILEDLSDRTDKQVQQITELLDQRSRALQSKIFEAEKQVRELDQSMKKSREVAEIFQDRIPHEEIIERQNTIKYVKAAQMAHKGSTIEEISAQVDLPREQLEFIAKVNRNQLMFDVEQLPAWVKPHVEEVLPSVGAALGPQSLETVFTPPSSNDYLSLHRIQANFSEAVQAAEASERAAVAVEAAPSQLVESAKHMTNKIISSASDFLTEQKKTAAQTVRTVRFPRID